MAPVGLTTSFHGLEPRADAPAPIGIEGRAVRFDIVTIFPRMVEALLEEGILARAVEAGVLDVQAHDLRDFTTDRHRVVDDAPFGGRPGMVLKP